MENGVHASSRKEADSKVLILGAAGRDYHLFNTKYRGKKEAEVVGFTHAQASDVSEQTANMLFKLHLRVA